MPTFKGVTDKAIASAKPGVYTVEPNLILRVSNSGSKAWVFRYSKAGKIKQIGLGSYPASRSLKAARDLADEMRLDVEHGREPVERVRPPVAKTFKHYALAYIGEFESGWKNPKHRQQWRNTLDAYAYPYIGEMPISDITADDIHKLLLPLWAVKTETATRVRMRIEAVLDYAFTKEGIDRRNPARWKGNLKTVLPNPRKVAKANGKLKSHAAPPWRDVPGIMANLRAKPEVTSALLLRFSILTAARSMEVRGATWDEVEGEVWTVPEYRSKNGELHRVPLNSEALEILAIQADRQIEGSSLIFPNPSGSIVSDIAINKVLHAAYPGITAHGIARSSFRDWIADATNVPDKIAEAALNHSNPNETEAAYLRTKFFDRRVELMKAWGEFCRGKDNVVELGRPQTA
ncbi:MAG: integrase arm-type DNA-binding domain-containing protein [Sphingomicrobium sp.]